MATIIYICCMIVLCCIMLYNYYQYSKCKKDLDLLEKAHVKLIEVKKSDDDMIRALEIERSMGTDSKSIKEIPDKDILELFVFLPDESYSAKNLGDPEEIYVLAKDAVEACSFVDTSQWCLQTSCHKKGIVIIKRRSTI